MDTAPLLIVDGDNLAHRAYHSTPKSVVGTNDLPINSFVGFFNMLINLWQKEMPRGVFVAWDTLGVDTYRNKLWPPYQGGRIFDWQIKQQLETFPTLCHAFGFGVGKEAGFEADDLMASAVKAETEQGGSCLLLTTDRDSYQLVTDRVTVLSPKRGTPIPDRIGPVQVVEYFGVLPEQVPEFKALSGDSSDKIPGIKGVGPKAAASLLLKHGSLEGVLEAWNSEELAKQALLFCEVATMQATHPVELPLSGPPDWLAGSEALKVLGANTLAERIAKLV